MTLVERAQAIMAQLDDVARRYDWREYGLPAHNDAEADKMVQLVLGHVTAVVAEEREACAKIAESEALTWNYDGLRQEIASAIRARSAGPKEAN